MIDKDGSIRNLRIIQRRKDWWCATPAAIITLPAVAADLDFPDIVFPADFLDDQAVIEGVVLMLYWQAQRDTSVAVNQIDQAAKTLRLKLSTAGWAADSIVAVTFALNQLYTPASGFMGGIPIVGSHDLKTVVTALNSLTYNVRSEETNHGEGITVTGASLVLSTVFTGLRVFYSMS